MDKPPKDWTPGRLSGLSHGYWSSCALHAGVKSGVTARLAQAGPLGDSAEQIAGDLGLDQRGAAMLLEALAALDIAVKSEGRYGLHPDIRPFLSPDSERDMSNIILHHADLVSAWDRLDVSVAKGGPAPGPEGGPRRPSRPNFYRGMRDLAAQQAKGLAARLGLSGGGRLLDLGGGPGVYACTFASETPELEAVVYDLEGARPFFEETAAMHPAARGRVSFLAGDFSQDAVDLGGSYQVVWMSQVLHSANPQACRRTVELAARALAPGGRLIIQEFILDDDRAGPAFPALFGLNMLVNTKGGQAYSWTELGEMMLAAGLGDIERLGATAPTSPAGLIQGFK